MPPQPGYPPHGPDGWWQLFDDAKAAKAARARRIRILLAAGAGVLMVAALVTGLALWLTSGSKESATAQPTPEPPSTPDKAAVQELSDLVPAGYKGDACKPGRQPAGTAATVECGRNADPAGPTSASYSLATDNDSLNAVFDSTVNSLTVVVCPGNIQSPGPWRRNATPKKVAGTLVCGMQGDRPVVAWTADSDRLLAVVKGDPRGPNLDQLYRWWSSHS
jgi:hypothetical protein